MIEIQILQHVNEYYRLINQQYFFNKVKIKVCKQSSLDDSTVAYFYWCIKVYLHDTIFLMTVILAGVCDNLYIEWYIPVHIFIIYWYFNVAKSPCTLVSITFIMMTIEKENRILTLVECHVLQVMSATTSTTLLYFLFTTLSTHVNLYLNTA